MRQTLTHTFRFARHLASHGAHARVFFWLVGVEVFWMLLLPVGFAAALGSGDFVLKLLVFGGFCLAFYAGAVAFYCLRTGYALARTPEAAAQVLGGDAAHLRSALTDVLRVI